MVKFTDSERTCMPTIFGTPSPGVFKLVQKCFPLVYSMCESTNVYDMGLRVVSLFEEKLTFLAVFSLRVRVSFFAALVAQIYATDTK